MRQGSGWRLLALGLMLVTCANPAWAHKFELVFVAPLSGPEQLSGRQALDGLMFATAEEDSHAMEHSDGHLGGLDSYVLQVDSAAGLRATSEELERLLRTRAPVFVTGLLDAGTVAVLVRRVGDRPIVVVDPTEAALWQSARAAPDDLRTMNGTPFLPAFEASFGYVPTAAVLQGYVAARLIAATVRSLSEAELGERAALVAAIARFRHHTFR